MPHALLEKIKAAVSIAERQCIINEAARTHQPRSADGVPLPASSVPGEFVVEGVSLAGHDLSGLWLTPFEMRRVDFRGARCQSATLPPLVDCVLDGVDARDAVLARVERCSLRGTILDGTFLGGDIAESDFSEASLRSARVGQLLPKSQAPGTFRANIFARARMDGFDAAGGNLEGSCFADACLEYARLSRSDLSRCDFRGARLQGANLLSAKVGESRWDGADIEQCLAGSDLATKLRGFGANGVARPLIGELNPQRISAVETALQPIPSCELRCDFVRAAPARRERVSISKRGRNGAVGFGAIATRFDGLFLRSYHWEQPLDLLELLTGVAADYADWRFDAHSVILEIDRTDMTDHVSRLFREALAELTSY